MSQRGLFIRTVVVEAGAPGQKGQRYEGLRTAFQVQHKAGGVSSDGRIEIYNPGRDAFQRFTPRTNNVFLKVGYDGDERLLFRGNPVRDGVELQVSGGGDRVLHVQATDGGAGFGTRITKSYAYSTTYDQVLANILEVTGWTKGQIRLPSVGPPGPMVFYDRPAEILDRMAAAAGGEWFVRDNALYIVEHGKVTTEGAILISQREGNLIGSPTATRTGVRLRALIDAALRPYMSIQVQSDLVNGYFWVTDVSFSGDNWSNEFYMDITARILRRPA